MTFEVQSCHVCIIVCIVRFALFEWLAYGGLEFLHRKRSAAFAKVIFPTKRHHITSFEQHFQS
jgi:hypothetical protein